MQFYGEHGSLGDCEKNLRKLFEQTNLVRKLSRLEKVSALLADLK